GFGVTALDDRHPGVPMTFIPGLIRDPEGPAPDGRHPGLDPGSRSNETWIPAFAGMTESLNLKLTRL
ncbi:MAG TPA: hypothetical protein VGA18_00040, partial [Rhodothermales bacterium]